MPKDPKLIELRRRLLRPWREVNDADDAAHQQTAMSDLAKLRTREAAAILAELLFANKETYYVIESKDGSMSVSYAVMIYLEKMLENAPEPRDGIVYRDTDLPIWQAWWLANRNRLVLRNSRKMGPEAAGVEPRLIERPWGGAVDGMTLGAGYIDIDGSSRDRLYFRYSPIEDSGVELERVKGTTIIWRKHVSPLGVEHSKYTHQVLVRLNAFDQTRFTVISIGDKVIHEERLVEDGTEISRVVRQSE